MNYRGGMPFCCENKGTNLIRRLREWMVGKGGPLVKNLALLMEFMNHSHLLFLVIKIAKQEGKLWRPYNSGMLHFLRKGTWAFILTKEQKFTKIWRSASVYTNDLGQHTQSISGKKWIWCKRRCLTYLSGRRFPTHPVGVFSPFCS